jgi:hypothetical protein
MDGMRIPYEESVLRARDLDLSFRVVGCGMGLMRILSFHEVSLLGVPDLDLSSEAERSELSDIVEGLLSLV